MRRLLLALAALLCAAAGPFDTPSVPNLGPSLDCPFLSATAAPGLLSAGPKCPTFTVVRASNATEFDGTGTMQTAALNVPVVDYDPVTLAPRGARFEESRVNSIRNNTMVGAVPGTPGTLPTNWFLSNAGTLAVNVIGTGTENGVTYVDLQVVGTTSTTFLIIAPELATTIVSANGQTWAASVFTKLVGGALTNVTSETVNIQSLTAAGSFLSQTSAAINVGSAALASQRSSVVYTIPDATNARVNGILVFSFSSGVALNFTTRIGLPDVELGPFATSAILTSGAAATRAADQISAAVGSWFHPANMTMVLEAMPEGPGTSNVAAWIVLEEALQPLHNRYTIRSNSNSTVTAVTEGNSTPQNLSVAPLAISDQTVFKYGIAASVSGTSLAGGNGAIATLAQVVAPIGVATLELGSDVGESRVSSGWARRLRIYPRMLSPAQFQATLQ